MNAPNAQQFHAEVMAQKEMEEAEQALPPHKRTGYYEQMCEYASYDRIFYTLEQQQ